jgi:uncharacterized protein (DUF1499 family)
MKHIGRWAILAALATFSTGWSLRADGGKPAAEAPRFDKTVREDIFAGFNGDAEAMQRGLRKCDEALQKDPKHAEAKVWRGAAKVFQASLAFRDKKQAEGFQLWTAGLKDMDEAVELDPKNVGVRVPRAVVLLPSAQNVPAAMAKPLLTKAVDDLETVYKAQEKVFHKLGNHPRGELRMGLAEAYRGLGRAEESRQQLEAITKEMAGTKYAERAKQWLQAEPGAKLAHSCIGCHRG